MEGIKDFLLVLIPFMTDQSSLICPKTVTGLPQVFTDSYLGFYNSILVVIQYYLNSPPLHFIIPLWAIPKFYYVIPSVLKLFILKVMGDSFKICKYRRRGQGSKVLIPGCDMQSPRWALANISRLISVPDLCVLWPCQSICHSPNVQCYFSLPDFAEVTPST